MTDSADEIAKRKDQIRREQERRETERAYLTGQFMNRKQRRTQAAMTRKRP